METYGNPPQFPGIVFISWITGYPEISITQV